MPGPIRRTDKQVRFFLCGDVMTGRGLDQILPHPSDPELFESYVKDARTYVELAEDSHGSIERPVDFAYPWGEALEELERFQPDCRLINLETSVTRSDQYWLGKGINYRMHPDNLPCLTAAGIDCCALANNHVLDWGYPGLAETLNSLEQAGLRYAGAGLDQREASAPAVLAVEGRGTVLVFSFGSASSGVPAAWAAGEKKPGVNFLEDLSTESVKRIGELIGRSKKEGDLVVASIHWGGNWGFHIPPGQRYFAHQLIANAGVDLVHGHSSHHVKGIEVYRDKLILYGCGDFLTDYEGIGGREQYRGDLGLMYFPTLERESGRLTAMKLVPTRLRRFQVRRAGEEATQWLLETLNRESAELGTGVELDAAGWFDVVW